MHNTLLHINEENGLQLAAVEMLEAKNAAPPTFYSAQEQQEYERLGSEKRRAERAATLHLLHNFLGVKNALHHRPNGSPCLADSNLHISISHAHRHVAVALHPTQKVGVDVENTQRNFARVASRFLSEREQSFCTTPTLQCLTWCAKETIFKIADEQSVDFAAQIAVEKFDEKSEGEILAHFFGKEKKREYRLRYHVVNGVAITCGVG